MTVTDDSLKNNSSIDKNTIILTQSVKITGSAQGGAGNYLYGVYYKKTSDTKWTTKQDFKSNNTVSIKPAHATTYAICIKVKDSDNTIVKKYFKVTVTKLTNTSQISSDSITLGSTVKVSCSGAGGAESYQYGVYYKKTSDTKWTTKQDFSTNTTVNVKPSKATSYEICVKVKDGMGTIAKKYFTVTVK